MRAPEGILSEDEKQIPSIQPLLHLLDTMVDKTILKAQNRALLLDDPDPGSMLDRLEATTVVHEPKWIGEKLT